MCYVLDICIAFCTYGPPYNRLAVNRTFSGRRFAGCLPFFRVGQGGVLEKQEASARRQSVDGKAVEIEK